MCFLFLQFGVLKYINFLIVREALHWLGMLSLVPATFDSLKVSYKANEMKKLFSRYQRFLRATRRWNMNNRNACTACWQSLEIFSHPILKACHDLRFRAKRIFFTSRFTAWKQNIFIWFDIFETFCSGNKFKPLSRLTTSQAHNHVFRKQDSRDMTLEKNVRLFFFFDKST